MRSVYLNLKDKNNPDLRAAVVSGAIDGKLLWSMSVQDLASAEKKKELAALTKEALFSAQGAAPKKSETDMFECGKCKKRRTTYYQMQTRSADEVGVLLQTRTLHCEIGADAGSARIAHDDLCHLLRVRPRLAGEYRRQPRDLVASSANCVTRVSRSSPEHAASKQHVKARSKHADLF